VAAPADPRNRSVLGEIEMGIASTGAKIATGSTGVRRERHERSRRAYSRAAQVLGALASCKGV
jgi:hypothetical protein